MKKFRSILLISVILTLTFSLFSCSENVDLGVGIEVENSDKPYFSYNESSITTVAEISVAITNYTSRTLESATFICEFRDAGGRIIAKRSCDVTSSIESGETYHTSFTFSGTGSYGKGAIDGKAASVTYVPYSITLGAETPAEKGERTFGFVQVLIILACIAAIPIGILLIRNGAFYEGMFLGFDWFKKYPEDGVKTYGGGLLIIAAVIFPIIYFIFIW